MKKRCMYTMAVLIHNWFLGMSSSVKKLIGYVRDREMYCGTCQCNAVYVNKLLFT